MESIDSARPPSSVLWKLTDWHARDPASGHRPRPRLMRARAPALPPIELDGKSSNTLTSKKMPTGDPDTKSSHGRRSPKRVPGSLPAHSGGTAAKSAPSRSPSNRACLHGWRWVTTGAAGRRNKQRALRLSRKALYLASWDRVVSQRRRAVHGREGRALQAGGQQRAPVPVPACFTPS